MDPAANRSPSPSSWRAWHEVHAPRLLLYARQWLPCRADAEDAVQAGFVKFWKHRPGPEAEDVPLLYTAVRCAALDLLKGRSRSLKREEAAHLTQEDVWWDAGTLEEKERAQMMQRALEQLPAEQREVVVLKVWAEMTFAQIADALGENQNTVAARHRYALAGLRKLLPEECHERH
jgi:RNA polymerase sigma-70 factor (ECF subfamily)